MTRLRTALRAVGGALLGLVPDALCIAGAALVVSGVWLIYRPAGMITAGMLLFTVGWRWAWILDRTA